MQEADIETAIMGACETLHAGGVIVYPTDTVYGFGADVTNGRAVQVVRTIKGREDTKPILAMVADVEMMEAYAVMTPLARELAVRFLPGPLSLILTARDDCLSAIATNDGAVGFRIPSHPFCEQLTKKYGFPITSTSANTSGKPQARELVHMLSQVGEEGVALIERVYDFGVLPLSAPSTIVDVRGDTPVVLREGAISRSTLFCSTL